MEIMLSHLGVGMAYDTLDGLNIHAQRLHAVSSNLKHRIHNGSCTLPFRV